MYVRNHESEHETRHECHSGRIQNQHSSGLLRRSWIDFPGVGDACRQIKTGDTMRISRDWVATLARLTMSSSIPGDPVARPGRRLPRHPGRSPGRLGGCKHACWSPQVTGVLRGRACIGSGNEGTLGGCDCMLVGESSSQIPVLGLGLGQVS